MNDTLAGLLQGWPSSLLLAVAYVPSATTWRASSPPRSTGGSRRWSTASCGSTPRPASAGRPTPPAVLGFSFVCIVLLYLLQRLQPLLPLSFGRDAVRRGWRSTPPCRSRRTRTGSPTCPSRSWATPGRWPGSPCRTSCRRRSGMAVAVALIRGILARPGRAPRQLLGRPHPRRGPHPAAALVRRRDPAGGGGVVMPSKSGFDVTTVDGTPVHDPARGPVGLPGGDQGAGTNGGGIFNANSAHPFENPNALHEPLRDLPAAA